VSGAEITAGGVAEWIRGFAAAVAEAKDELTALDSAIGDADHGINMDRGFTAVVQKLDAETPADIPGLMKAVGMTLISKVGGAGGPLYGTLFLQFGQAAPPDGMAPDDFAACLDAAVAGVQSRGKAEPGDKTMIDALLPAGDALRAALADGAGFGAALERAADAAEEGARATIPLVARKGRASYLGERSAGHQDPGATSSALLVRCAARTWPD
jgi:dihydroxyacetone kinase-like protein